jgi:hypothetical protein
MRAITMLAVLAATPAAADPKPPPTAQDFLPDLVEEMLETTTAMVTRGGAVGIDGKQTAGMVIKPPYHPDGEPVSRGGGWMVPPDTNDLMSLETGTNQLRSREQVTAWLPRDLSRGLKRGADKVWDLVLPKL